MTATLRTTLTVLCLVALAACAKAGPSPEVLKAGQTFLAGNAHAPGVQVTASGLQYKVLTSGPATGTPPTASDEVKVNYEGKLLDGTVFDSSYARGEPAVFGVTGLIPAWTEALQLMRPGDVWMLYAPADLAYGDRGAGPIPPGSVLAFKIELIAVIPAAASAEMDGRGPDLARRALDILGALVAFDTTSHRSNLQLIAWVEAYLAAFGVASARVPNADGVKANLTATIGPAVAGGVVLSGHTDVVPVEGQPWTSDPFVLTRRGARLFGRGTCDMKGFLALALAAVPDLLAAAPLRPAHLAFTYDEEIGCLGAPGLIAEIARTLPAPMLVLVGEPTSLKVVSAHKGIQYFEVVVRGREAHSSQPHLGASAIMASARLMGLLTDLAERLEREADPDSPFEPKGPTLTIGEVRGGTAPNILALDCRFVFDLRAQAGFDVAAALAPFFALAASEDAAIKARAPDGGVTVRRVADVPGFRSPPGSPAEILARRLAGDNGPLGAVSFAAEAGQFQAAGFDTLICGPGSIDQAHQPDEYVDIAQMERGADMMVRLIDELARV